MREVLRILAGRHEPMPTLWWWRARIALSERRGPTALNAALLLEVRTLTRYEAICKAVTAACWSVVASALAALAMVVYVAPVVMKLLGYDAPPWLEASRWPACGVIMLGLAGQVAAMLYARQCRRRHERLKE